MTTIPVGVSNRHIHLSQHHLDALFGKGYKLSILKDLSQPGQYAANETVTIEGSKGRIDNVRILGPVRKQTQIEISRTDSFGLGVNPPVRDSGDLKGSASLKVIGPKGEVTLEEGVIIASRHIHFHTDEAGELGINNGDLLSVQAEGERGLIFHQVLARVHDNYRLDMHIDTDEANAAGIRNGDSVILLGVK